ncbi:MAG: NUDIX hydrolase [Candidatus Microsaccharimonas sp.]
MFEQNAIQHHIQRHIIGVLLHTKYARFSELRPPKVDTNLFTYHLKVLMKQDWVKKTDYGYTLTKNGLIYVDRVSESRKTLRTQPKIITMLVVQNSEGDILLQKRRKQPFTGTWTLPYGKIHNEDVSAQAAAQREVFEKIGIENQEVEHAGDCYIRVHTDWELLSTTLAHVFRFYKDDVVLSDRLMWARPHKLDELPLAPAVNEVMTRTFFKDAFYFEEFNIDWKILD